MKYQFIGLVDWPIRVIIALGDFMLFVERKSKKKKEISLLVCNEKGENEVFSTSANMLS